MKIISKYKDYYDYLVQEYGEDPLLVLDRRVGTTIQPPASFAPDSLDSISICFCGKRYYGVISHHGVYWGDNMLKVGMVLEENKWRETRGYAQIGKYSKQSILTVNADTTDTIINDRLGCPVVYVAHDPYNNPIMVTKEDKYDYDNGRFFHNFPKLSDIGFASLVSPKEAWLKLTEWLSTQKTKAEKKVPIGSDEVRIKSHGFDVKSSFRPNMKKK